MFASRRAQELHSEFPLMKDILRKEQLKELKQRSSKIQKLIENKDSGYYFDDVDGVKLIMYNKRIYIPKSLRTSTINWYHYYLNHPGGDRLGNTIKETCYWNGLQNQAKAFVKTCKVCQEYKKKKKYGHLPPKDIDDELTPWKTVHLDLIGPYTVTCKQTQPGDIIKEVELNLVAMTMVDPATGLFEMVEVPYYDAEGIKNGNQDLIDKTSARISKLFNNTWLCRYPRPREVIFDNGSEFKKNFVVLLKDFDIKPKVTTVENPQGNSPVERIHQVVHNMIKTHELDDYVFDYIDPWGEILSSVVWAIRASYHSTLQATPAQLVFGRDMLFNIRKVINWKLITDRKREQVRRDNDRENSQRIPHEYQIGDKVVRLKRGIKRKYSKHKSEPYQVREIHTNGTITIVRGAKHKTLNIQNVESFNAPDNS